MQVCRLPLVWWAVLAAALAGGAWLHLRAGLSLPYPCGDEVVFYYPAQALGLHGSLASDHLYPGRTLHWMPPGYMATLALWLRGVGEGLAQARWLSFVLGACALLGLTRLWLRLGLQVQGLMLLAVAFCSRHWVVMGNFVRMEALLLCLLLLALHQLWQGRTLAGAALALLGLTVHPNAIYMVLALPGLAALAPRRSYRGRANLAVGLLALLVVGGYGFYVLAHWADFWHDWSYQLSSRSAEGLRVLLWRPDQAVFATALAGLAYWAWRTGRRAIGFALVAAVVFWAMRVLGQGWAYGIYNVVALTLVLGCLLAWAQAEVWPRLLARRPALHPWATAAAALGLMGLLIIGKIYNLPLYGREPYFWMGMVIQPPEKPYLTDADRQAVLKHLYKTLPAGRRHKLYCVPEGEGMWLQPADTGRILHVLPIFGHNLPTYFLIHRSAYADFYHEAIEETWAMLPPGQPRPAPFYTRQGTEQWWLVPVQQGRLPAYILRVGDPRLPNQGVKN